MSNDQETIIRKIQKLLALGQSSNEAEANLAMARAQELLAKHNLEFEMVKDASVAGGTNAPEEKREKTRVNRSATYAWQRELWKAICEANFCWYAVVECYDGKRGTKQTSSRKPVKRHMIIGRESNVIAVKIMGEYLEDTIERILPFPNNERLSRSAHSWKAGCAERLAERIAAQAEERKRASEAPGAESGALVLRSVYEREFQANYDVRYGKGAWERKLLCDAEWEAGREQRERDAAERTAKAEREWLEYLQSETPEQKKAREREEAKERLKEERARERRYRTWENERRKESRKVDWEAREAGAKAGSKISLNTQVGAGSPRKDRSIE